MYVFNILPTPTLTITHIIYLLLLRRGVGVYAGLCVHRCVIHLLIFWRYIFLEAKLLFNGPISSIYMSFLLFIRLYSSLYLAVCLSVRLMLFPSRANTEFFFRGGGAKDRNEVCKYCSREARILIMVLHPPPPLNSVRPPP